MTLLVTQGLCGGYGAIKALRDVDISVEQGEAVTIIGANGAGKTTLLRTIAGLQPASGGTILHGSVDVTRWPAEKRSRAGIVLVPEGRQIFGGLSVRDNLVVGAFGHRRDRNIQETMEKVFELFPMLQEHTKRPGGSLSGGQQQMLAIGRALMAKPDLLLLDEPSLGLAPLIVQELVKKLQQLRGLNTGILLIEQNAAAAFAVADRGYVLERGEITAAGTVHELRHDPRVRESYLGG